MAKKLLSLHTWAEHAQLQGCAEMGGLLSSCKEREGKPPRSARDASWKAQLRLTLNGRPALC